MEDPPRPDEQTSSVNLAELSAALRDLADERQRELQIRLIEAELEKERITNAHHYSLEFLKVSLQDRDNERQARKRNSTVGAVASIVLAVLLIGFFSLAVWKGKDQLVIEVVKAVLAFAGGYGFGRGRKAKEKEEDAPAPKPQ
jgi:hypothetical protein